jgi:hypothetical protein
VITSKSNAFASPVLRPACHCELGSYRPRRLSPFRLRNLLLLPRPRSC